jgi:hypothetical protein
LPDVIEFLESRSIQTSGGRGTGTRVFHVTGTTSVRTVHNLLGKAGDNGVEMPNVGDAHPDFPGLRARDFSVSLVAGHNDTWRVDWTYEVISRGFPQYPTTVITELPNEVGYLELSSEIRAEFVLAWRKNGTPSLTYPQNGQVTNPTQDIRGEPVDQAGNPISVQRNIQELTITENVEVSGVVDLSILPVLSQLGELLRCRSRPRALSWSVGATDRRERLLGGSFVR